MALCRLLSDTRICRQMSCRWKRVPHGGDAGNVGGASGRVSRTGIYLADGKGRGQARAPAQPVRRGLILPGGNAFAGTGTPSAAAAPAAMTWVAAESAG